MHSLRLFALLWVCVIAWRRNAFLRFCLFASLLIRLLSSARDRFCYSLHTNVKAVCRKYTKPRQKVAQSAYERQTSGQNKTANVAKHTKRRDSHSRQQVVDYSASNNVEQHWCWLKHTHTHASIRYRTTMPYNKRTRANIFRISGLYKRNKVTAATTTRDSVTETLS